VTALRARHRAGRTKLRGRVRPARSGKLKIELRRRAGGRWTVVRSRRSRVRAGGRFTTTMARPAPGRYRMVLRYRSLGGGATLHALERLTIAR
jgi:hypothetical protein